VPTLEFKGKPFVYSHHLSVPFRELRIDADKSLPAAAGPSLDDNLIIHGDNLEALKALLPRYAGKVDVIYIDPPYNTGNERWTYNDNVNAPALKEWLGKVVDAEDMERHDKWLAMMWPRLQLLWELLAEAGSIWISCDDNERDNLKSICDESFGAASFVDAVIWQKNYSPKPTVDQFSADHDYILIYAKGGKDWKPGVLPRTEAQDRAYKNPDNDPRGPWKPGDLSLRNYYSKGTYSITTPSGRLIKGPPAGRYWAISEESLKELDGDSRIWWGEKGSNVPSTKQFLSEVRDGRVPQTLWFYGEVGHTQEAKKELFALMGWTSNENEETFATPKPSRLIEKVLTIGGKSDALVLDSFAGSGTTAQAALALNAADGGTRRFILVETENYADTLTAERVRRVIKGVPDAKDEALRGGLGGSFTYCDLSGVMDLERFFAGDDAAPAWNRLAEYVAYTATGATLKVGEEGPEGYAGDAAGFRLHLIYRPNQAWMRSNEAMLDMATAERIKEAAAGRPVLVFAAGKFMAQKALTGMGLTFCQLPYSIHRILGDGSEGVAGVDEA
jgi:adenine-specific DNA-methyltransferase